MNAGGVLNTCKSSGKFLTDSFGMKSEMESGGWVSNAWETCPVQGDSLGKPGLIPHNVSSSHDLEIKTPVVQDGPASH